MLGSWGGPYWQKLILLNSLVDIVGCEEANAESYPCPSDKSIDNYIFLSFKWRLQIPR
jgi:hypothetical protein